MVLLSNYSFAYLKPTSKVYTIRREVDASKNALATNNILFFSAPFLLSKRDGDAPSHPQNKSPKNWRSIVHDAHASPMRDMGDPAAMQALRPGTTENVLLGFAQLADAQFVAQCWHGNVQECIVRELVDYASLLNMPCSVIVNSYCPLPAEEDKGAPVCVHYELFYSSDRSRQNDSAVVLPGCRHASSPRRGGKDVL